MLIPIYDSYNTVYYLFSYIKKKIMSIILIMLIRKKT